MYKDNDIFRVAGVMYSFKELKKEFFDNNNQYIIKYKSIYQVFYSVNAGFYTNEIYYNYNALDVGYTLKGRHIWADHDFVNKLVGFELVHVNN